MNKDEVVKGSLMERKVVAVIPPIRIISAKEGFNPVSIKFPK